MRLLAAIRRHGDLAFALAALLAVELEVWLAADVARRPATALLAIPATLPLAVRARYPLLAFLVGFGSLLLMTKVSPNFDERGLTFVLLYVFWLYSLGANTRGRQAWAAAVIVPVSVIGFVTDDGDAFHPGDIAFGAFIIGGPWLAGLLIRLRRQSERRLGARAVELERERDERARAAVAEERARIARELHDVVAHAISVVIVQARGGRAQLRAGAPDESLQAFDAIERTGEQALGEMRRLLGLLRQDDEQLARSPQPSLARLDALAEHVRAAGLPVEVRVDGERVDLPPGVDLSAYRIVQEALTNALKHAGRARAVVHVAYGPEVLEVEVTDDGAGAASGNGAGGGHGLIGIRERVALVGGELDAGPLPGGGFVVRARLPYEADPVIRLLIADDQALVRAGFRMILAAEPDLDVVGEAGDGAAAVALAADLRPDVVLMDVRMPDVDGIEATRRLQALPEPPRVLVLTTFDLDEVVYEALRAGASGFLLKDAPEAQLLTAIRVVADGASIFAPSVTRRLVAEFARRSPAASPPGLADLTPREHDVLRLVARGLSNAEIAATLVLSEHTVKTHVAHILLKLGLRDRTQAVVVAYESGLVQPGAA